ncbi:peptidyl-tRNA hydrolase [Clostridiales bacterium PH28_bin88]|nr:peptidyl-tRNA hydrolase [Clostridiales bacterium PH28_bin88]
MKMLVGLGNPGARYETTKHNVGMMVIDLLADELGIEVTRSRCRALVGEGRVGAQRVALVKPQTFMNLSGEAVGPLANWYKIPPEDIIVIHDDLDLDTGRLRLRARGGDGGHRGIRSIMDHLGTDRFVRVKIGVGRPPAGWDAADHVLAPFSDDEWSLVEQALARAAEAARALLETDVEAAMNRYNR